MRKPTSFQSGLLNARASIAFLFFLVSGFLALIPLTAAPPGGIRSWPGNSFFGDKYARALSGNTRKRTATPLAPGAMGIWTIVASPNTSSTQTNYLEGVSCTSASDCWAVGYYYAGSIYQTLIQRWDGTTWTIIASPNTSATEHNVLHAVACSSVTSCWAVGYHTGNGSAGFQALIERWDGTSWSIVTLPSTATWDQLQAVTCISTSDCWAVGFSDNSRTLIERWDGISWTVVASPNTTEDNQLFGVACTTASDCWVVGYYFKGGVPNSDFKTLVEHWNGSSWAIIASPNTSTTQDNRLYRVSCTSASNCWAVGFYFNGSNYETLVERWDGSAWGIVPSPSGSGGQNDYLYGVTCTSASNCWAVGWSGSTSQTLIERWDGTSWTIVTSPNSSATQGNFIGAVTCTAASDCWTVGSFYTGSVYQTLIERGPLPPKMTSVSRFADGRVALAGEGLPRSSINIEVSPDLVVPFTKASTVISDGDGLFQYEDIDATILSKRFYRASYQ